MLIPITHRQKISKDIEDLNTISQLDLIDIYKKFHPTTTEYTFFSSAHETFTKKNKTKAKKKTTTQNIFKVLKQVSLEIMNRNTFRKVPNI